jgi:hypothetical protein
VVSLSTTSNPSVNPVRCVCRGDLLDPLGLSVEKQHRRAPPCSHSRPRNCLVKRRRRVGRVWDRSGKKVTERRLRGIANAEAGKSVSTGSGVGERLVEQPPLLPAADD